MSMPSSVHEVPDPLSPRHTITGWKADSVPATFARSRTTPGVRSTCDQRSEGANPGDGSGRGKSAIEYLTRRASRVMKGATAGGTGVGVRVGPGDGVGVGVAAGVRVGVSVCAAGCARIPTSTSVASGHLRETA
jgi:hypothetical protein